MPEPKADENPVDELAEDFARRWRGGERPSVEDYAARYPQWADEIREVLPAVVMMEQLKPRREDAAPPPGPDRMPERVGDYRVIRELGRGGMGVVYEAEQEALGRRVAIKVLPGHLLANERLRSRFRREAHAAARLHHTNIVPVFGVGEAEGQCFYVMQLIRGRGLDRVVREAAAARGDPPPELGSNATAPWVTPPAADTPVNAPDRTSAVRAAEQSPAAQPSLAGLPPRDFCRAVARIGAQVADALAYAHGQGVLHRDIKPSNLLLDDRGAVWVTDFGVAKLVEEANLTQSGDLVGTLKYMPPERFAGKSDGRGDVYSLGVTLYELLTLRSAFPDTTPHHLIRLITQEAPARPRKLNPDIPADLETVVLKAAARDPDQRYQSPAELAEDLRRFLDDRPIVARRAGPAEQAWRWCRRNPALAAATATAFLLMVAVTAVSVAAYVQTAAANKEASDANREMTKALTAETAQREHAEETATLALAALNRTYDRFAPTRLVATAPASNEEGVELPPQPALPPEVAPLLEDLLRTYEQVARSGGEFPRLQAQAAEANYRIGDLRQRLGRYEEAAAAYRAAIDLYDRLPADTDGGAVRIKLARACNELGRTLGILQRPEEAGRMHERAIRALSDAPAEFAARPECRYELARTYYTLGQWGLFLPPPGPGPGPPRWSGPGRGGDRGPPGFGPDRPPGPGILGDHPARRAVPLLEQLTDEYPSVPEYRHLLACCYRDLPPDRFGPGRPPANSNAEKAVGLLRQLVTDFPRVPDYRFDLCETLARPHPPSRPGAMSADPSARERLTEAVKLSGELVAQYPNVPDYTAAHARYLDILGVRTFEAGEFAEAEKLHRKAIGFQVKLVKQYPEVVAYGYWLSLMERSLGQALGEQGELKEARTRLESAADRLERLRKKDPRLGPAGPFLGMVYRELAEVLARSGEQALADEALHKAEEFGRGGPRPFGPRGPGGGRP